MLYRAKLIRALLLFILVSWGLPVRAMHPEAKNDFIYENKFSKVKYIIRYVGDGTWVERILGLPNKERVRWQVRCKSAEIRSAWYGDSYPTQRLGRSGDVVDVWKRKPVKYVQYSCNGPKQFMRFWPALPVTKNDASGTEKSSNHQRCLSAKDFMGCMKFYSQ